MTPNEINIAIACATPTFDEWKRRAKKAEAACAEKQWALQHLFNEQDGECGACGCHHPIHNTDCRLQHALSTDCGKGWVSPEEAKKLKQQCHIEINRAIRARNEARKIVIQRDQVLTLLHGGTLTEAEVEDSGLGRGVLIEQRHHEAMRCKAEAACAEKQWALQHLFNEQDGECGACGCVHPIHNTDCRLQNAISSDCGKGWVSPADYAKEREYWTQQAGNWEHRADDLQRKLAIAVKALKVIKQNWCHTCSAIATESLAAIEKGTK